MPNYEEIIQQSQKNIRALSHKLIELDNFQENIEKLIKQPEILEDKFKQITKLASDYTNTLGFSTKKYIEITDNLLSAKLVDLDKKTSALQKEITRLVDTDIADLFNGLQNAFLSQSKDSIESGLNQFENNTTKLLEKHDGLHAKLILDIKSKTDELHKEITRLTETDITNLFNDLKKAFIEQASKDLSVELNKIDEKTEVLQTVIEGIQKEATRLEEIDLEKHFVKHQKTLSEIFGAVNSINTVLSGITQTLTGITQGIGNLQNSYDEKHKESKQQIESYGSQISSLLTNQSSEIKKTTDILNVEVEIIKEQNRNLKKESKTMRIIQIVEIVIILSFITYTIIF
jgi:hypothetical protein